MAHPAGELQSAGHRFPRGGARPQPLARAGTATPSPGERPTPAHPANSALSAAELSSVDGWVASDTAGEIRSRIAVIVSTLWGPCSQ